MATKAKKVAKSKTKAKTAKKLSKTGAKTAQKHPQKVASRAAAKASAKSSVRPGMKKVEVKKPVNAVKQTTLSASAANKPAKPHMVAVATPSLKPAVKVAVAPPAAGKKTGFGVGEYVVYPTHGVGRILGIESETIGTFELKVFVIAFEKDKMTLRVPVGRAEAAGLRSISPNDQIVRAITTLKGRAKIARGMWSRRAQEYEAKINSGNLVAIAEVVRDLHKNVDQSERSYSERMIYETAMHRLCGEVAASERVDIKSAQEKLLKVLRKQAAAAA